MSLFEMKPLDRRIYEEELKDFLPPKMIDIHCHVWLYELSSVGKPRPGEPVRTVAWPYLIAKDNSIEDLQESYRLFFPGAIFTGVAGVYYGTFLIELTTAFPILILLKREFRLLRSGLTKWKG